MSTGSFSARPRALVTGAAGFIGSHVADHCLALGMDVVATDDLSGGFRENVPAAAAMILAARRPVLPERKILETTQDRLAEKDFVKRLGIGTADYADVSSAVSLRAAISRIGLPAVLKTRRFGYDGKGQAIIRAGDDPDMIWDDLGTKSAILEAFIPFQCEISVIAARSADGHVECFDVTENEHRDHILKTSHAPANISDALADEARDPGLARAVAEVAPRTYELSVFLTGVLGVTDVGAYFPHRVTYHPTCHSLRMLKVGDAPLKLLRAVRGIDLVELPRAEECCGFGGTFAVKNADTSMAMLGDKLRCVLDTRAEFCSSADNSCLMHIGGALHRQRAGVGSIHLAEVLASTESDMAMAKGAR